MVKLIPKIFITSLILFVSELMMFIFPSRRTSVLSWLIFNLEYAPNKSRVSKRAVWDDLSRTKDVMSSANATNLISFPSTMIPLIWLLFRIDIISNSSAMMKREGDNGSPCQTPRLSLKEGVKKPLLVTQLAMLL